MHILLICPVCSILRDPAQEPLVQPFPETKNDGEPDNKGGHTATNGPEVTLCFVCVGDTFDIHPKV